MRAGPGCSAAFSGLAMSIVGCQFLVPDPLVPCTTNDECGLNQSCQAGFCRNTGVGQDFNCGDGFCEIGETVRSCRADCEDFLPGDAVCGNDFCELGESGTNCPLDCEFGFPGDGLCGNDICERGETDNNCAFDCDDGDEFECGDGDCDFGENQACPTDCDADNGNTNGNDNDNGNGNDNGGECGPTCVSNLGCDDGDDCTTDDCVPAPSRCGLVNVCRNEQVQCPFGQRCANGFCQITGQCFIDADCGIGRQCIGGQCVP